MFNRLLKTNRKPRLGLALSGGGARGLIHIGVLKVLEKEGIPIDYIAGASMGGVIAAGYAAGMSPKELERIATDTLKVKNIMRFIDPALPNGGLIRGQRLLDFFRQHIGDRTFAELKIPLALTSVDLNSRKEVVLKEGSVALALRASTAVPGIFTPLELNGWRLVDGGVLNNLPVDVLRQMGAERVLAINCRSSHSSGAIAWFGEHRWIPKGISFTLNNVDETLSLLLKVTEEQKLHKYPPDLLIQPEIPADVNVFAGYDRINELIAIGEKATEQKMPEINSLLRKNKNIPFLRDIRLRNNRTTFTTYH